MGDDIPNGLAAYEIHIDAWLSPKATRTTQGRERPISPDVLRTDFQRDRDRILHCKSFRQLMHKTQVFVAPEGDYYRTRLTHTLEVSQISRTIARMLRLNEDLTEAIALGHDLGHTPFGHMGERCLAKLSPCGFRHNEQSLRVVERLEGGQGLNLTWEVRDGILHHRSGGTPGTPEGCVVQLADKIAYVNHDIDDAIRAGLITLMALPPEALEVFGVTHGERIERMVLDVVNNSHNEIRMSPEAKRLLYEMRAALSKQVYHHEMATLQEEKALRLLNVLYRYYLEHPEALPQSYQGVVQAEGVERAVCDHLAGMTDRYAVRVFEGLTVPSPWD